MKDTLYFYCFFTIPAFLGLQLPELTENEKFWVGTIITIISILIGIWLGVRKGPKEDTGKTIVNNFFGSRKKGAINMKKQHMTEAKQHSLTEVVIETCFAQLESDIIPLVEQSDVVTANINMANCPNDRDKCNAIMKHLVENEDFTKFQTFLFLLSEKYPAVEDWINHNDPEMMDERKHTVDEDKRNALTELATNELKNPALLKATLKAIDINYDEICQESDHSANMAALVDHLSLENKTTEWLEKISKINRKIKDWTDKAFSQSSGGSSDSSNGSKDSKAPSPKRKERDYTQSLISMSYSWGPADRQRICMAAFRAGVTEEHAKAAYAMCGRHAGNIHYGSSPSSALQKACESLVPSCKLADFYLCLIEQFDYVGLQEILDEIRTSEIPA